MHIHGQIPVNALEHIVTLLEGAAGNGAITHGDGPFGGRHLFPQTDHRGGHFLGDGAGYDHEIALPRRRSKDPGPEPVQVEPGHACGHHFNGTAGQTEGHGPQGVGPGQIQGLLHETDVN